MEVIAEAVADALPEGDDLRAELLLEEDEEAGAVGTQLAECVALVAHAVETDGPEAGLRPVQRARAPRAQVEQLDGGVGGVEREQLVEHTALAHARELRRRRVALRRQQCALERARPSSAAASARVRGLDEREPMRPAVTCAPVFGSWRA